MGNLFSKKVKVVSKEGVCITDIKHQIKPLDLIVFRGSEFVSDAISFVEKISLGKGDWTHIGIVVTPEIMPIHNSVPGKLYIWESTMSGKLLGDGVNNIETNGATFGVQIRELEDVLDKYDNDPKTRVGWCRLIKNPLDQLLNEDINIYNTRRKFVIDTVTRLNKQIGNATYDYNCCNLFSTVCCTCSSYRREIFGHPNRYFCSELVAKVYIELGIIRKNIDPEKVAPEEFLGYTNDGIKQPVDNPVVITRVWKK